MTEPEAVKVFHDQAGQNIAIWFGNLRDGHIVETKSEDFVLVKDEFGNVAGC